MKAPRFGYLRPEKIDDALQLLAEHGDDARILAGGQSLVPVLNMRLAHPKLLIDINQIEPSRESRCRTGRSALARSRATSK
jgi:CO/xanthine dehydrogenase FAD-binding subunit